MLGSKIEYNDGMSQFTGVVVAQTEGYIDVAFECCDSCNEIIPSTRIKHYKRSLKMGFIRVLN